MRQIKERDNIYRAARSASGLTQERWAEVLGVSVSAVQKYESGEIMPEDDVVLSMADYSGMQILGTWHMRRKSAIAATVVPEVQRLPLAQAVVQLLAAIRDFDAQHHEDALLLIAADGRVDETEAPRYKAVVRDLHALIRAAMQIDYAEQG